MNLWKWARLAATAQIVVLAACVPTVMTPTVTATPGPGKLPADLASDHIACTAQASQQMAPAVQAANNQVTGIALQNVLTGTGDNAVDCQHPGYGHAAAAIRYCLFGLHVRQGR